MSNSTNIQQLSLEDLFGAPTRAARPKARIIPFAPVGPLRPVLPLEPQLARLPPRWRRRLDVGVALAALLLLSPLLLLVALAIKLTSPGPVLFIQERTGLNMRRFRMFKFRTMVCDAEKQLAQIRGLNEMSGPLIKIRHDPRLTPVGHLLRTTSLDELPQLLNVLKGDMTFIGPRALSPRPEQYEPWQRRRFSVMPGLACVWQAERRDERDFTEWMRTDLHYIEQVTPRAELSLALKIVLRVLRCSGS